MKNIKIIITVIGLVFFTVDTYAENWFIKVNGAGDGTSWDNALSGEQFIVKIEDGTIADGDVVYMAAGRYLTGTTSTDVLTFTQDVTIKGGYNPESTGTNTDISYPSVHETILSGDLNDNGISDEGDCRVLEIKTTKTINLSGITIANGYTNTANRPGIHADGGAIVNLDYCKVVNNQSALTTPSGDAGGAGILVANATVNCYKTIISDNTSNNRGGAIRMTHNDGVLVLNACLLTRNSIIGNYGGAVQMSPKEAKFYCINTTITENTANLGGAGVNGGGYIYIVSSTIVDNYCSDGSQGHDIRVESSENAAFIINSIVVGSDTKKITPETPNIIVNGASNRFSSAGSNVIGCIGGTGAFNSHSLDVVDKFYAGVFGSNVLADNDGFPQTIALIKNDFRSMTLASLESFKTLYNIPENVDLTVDQRGKQRKQETSVGAYENSTSTTALITVDQSSYIVYPTRVVDRVTISRAEGSKILLYNMKGELMHQIKDAGVSEYINMSSYPKGMYLLSVGGRVTKLIK